MKQDDGGRCSPRGQNMKNKFKAGDIVWVMGKVDEDHDPTNIPLTSIAIEIYDPISQESMIIFTSTSRVKPRTSP